MSLGEAAIRALGADPAVFCPIARAQSRILSRRTQLVRGRGIGRIVTRGMTPFQLRCLMYFVISLVMMGWILVAPSPLFTASVVLTAGSGFLILDLLFDKLDVLADPDEYQVIAAHPHDAWSVLLAKLVIIGRNTSALAACVFLVPAIATGFALHSVAAGLAFAVSAAALTAAIWSGGMLVSALLIAIGGRRAFDRFLPVVHVVYLILYMGVFFLRGTVAEGTVNRLASAGWIQWALPSMWFAAPIELASGHGGAAAVARGALAIGTLALMIPLSAMWVRNRFDERILEPPRRRRARSLAPLTPAGTAAQPAPMPATRVTSRVPSDRAIGMRTFHKILMAHLRSDATVRGGFMMAFLMPAMMIGSQMVAGGVTRRPAGLFGLGMTALFLAESFFTRTSLTSAKPSAIWFVLVSPGARIPYSRALAATARLIVVLPAVIAAAVLETVSGTGPLWIRVAFVILIALLCDGGFLALRALNPEVPFSIAVRSKRSVPWFGVVLWLVVLVAITLTLVAFILVQRWAPLACLIVVGYAAAGRVAVGFWAMRQIDRTARETEGL